MQSEWCYFISLEKVCVTECLKIIEKVAFNIASEASYVYSLYFEWPKVY